MKHPSLFCLGAGFLVAAWAAPADALTLRTSAYFSSGDDRPCNVFSFAGAPVACDGVALFQTDAPDVVSEVTFSSLGSAEALQLRTRSRLSMVDAPFDPFAVPPDDVDDVDGPPMIVAAPRPFFIDSYAAASWRDTWTILGGDPGQTGAVQLAFLLDGSDGTVRDADLLGQSISSATSISVREIGLIDSGGGSGVIGVVQQGTTINRTTFDGLDSPYDELAILELGFTFGQSFDIDVFLTSVSQMSFFDEFSGNAETFSDFASTATLAGVTVIDATGQSVPFQLLSDTAAFAQFSTQGPEPEPDGSAVIPVPAAGLLLGSALLGLSAWRRFARA